MARIAAIGRRSLASARFAQPPVAGALSTVRFTEVPILGMGGLQVTLVRQAAMGDVAPFDQDFRGRLGQFGHRLVDRGQRRPEKRRFGDVIEARHPQFFRNPPPNFAGML